MAKLVSSLPPSETEAAEAEYLTARVRALAGLSGNPYNVDFKTQGGLQAFLVQSMSNPMMNRICGDCRSSPDDLSALIAWFAGRCCLPAIPLAFAAGKPASREQIGAESLRRLNGWTHVQLTAPLGELSVRQSDLPVDELTPDNLDAFAMIHAEAFRTPLERQAVNRASFYELIAGNRAKGFLIMVDGKPAAGAIVYFASNGVAYLGTAATRRNARGHGCHTALIGCRITAARQHGSRFIAATATLRSQSRRNLERIGLTTSHVQALYSP